MDLVEQPPPALIMSPVAARQFSYHVRLAASTAVAGNVEESAAEAVLAWSMLCSCCPTAMEGASGVAAELIDPERISASDADRRRAHSRAHDLALSLEAHFVSVGQHEAADLYEKVADELDQAIAALIAH